MRAYTRLIQLQGPLAGAFLKDIPKNGKTFWNSAWTALSRFRFGIPLSSALSSAAKWGDEAVDKHDELSLQRHDRVRNALARSLRGIRAFCAHTECRLGTSNLYSDLTVFEGLNGATRANPLELDIHVHHVCKVETSGYFRAPSCWLNQRDNAKRHKYGGVCQALGHSFLPMGFTAWGAMSSGTTQLLEKVAVLPTNRAAWAKRGGPSRGTGSERCIGVHVQTLCVHVQTPSCCHVQTLCVHVQTPSS